MSSKITPTDALIRANASYDAFGSNAAALAKDPRLTADERQVLLRARDVALQRRLRDEHPVLARFVAFIEGRGKPVDNKEDWETLKTLLGPEMSESEKDALDLLAKKELFTPEIRDQYFSSYRETHRDKRISMVKSAGFKSGAARVSTIIANMGVAIGASLIFPPALLAIIPGQIIAHRKIDGAINSHKNETIGSYGVNRIGGEEVDDEARLVLSHLSQFNGLDGDTAASLIDTAKADIVLVQNLQQTRSQAPPDGSAESQRMGAAVGGYVHALEQIVAEHGENPRSAGQLRKAIHDARATALSPDVIRASVVSTVRANARPIWPELELAFADVQAQALAAAEAALAPDGLATQEQRESIQADAAAFLGTVEAMKSRAPGFINKELQAFFEEAYAGVPTLLASDATKKLRKNLDKVRSAVTETKSGLEGQLTPVTRDQAEDIAQDVANSVFEKILPRFVGVDGAAKLKFENAEPLEDGGFRLQASFKRGLTGSGGSFSLVVAKDGMPDADSLEFEVDEARAREIANATVAAYDQLFNDSPGVSIGAVRNPQRQPGDAYQLSGSLADGANRFKLNVSADGLPDRASLAIS